MKYQCRKCQRYGHFTSRCLTKGREATSGAKQVNAVAAQSSPQSSDDDLDAIYICSVNTPQPKKRVFADLRLATKSGKLKFLKVRLDTAADVSIMSKSVYEQLFHDPKCKKLKPVTSTTVMHDNTKAEILGSIQIPIVKDNKTYGVPFQVVPYEASTLLSCEQVTKLGLVMIPKQKKTPKHALIYGSSVDIKYVNFLQRNNPHKPNWYTRKSPPTSLEEIKAQYKDVFEGLGTFPGKPYHINTDPSVPPKRLPCRTISVHQ